MSNTLQRSRTWPTAIRGWSNSLRTFKANGWFPIVTKQSGDEHSVFFLRHLSPGGGSATKLEEVVLDLRAWKATPDTSRFRTMLLRLVRCRVFEMEGVKVVLIIGRKWETGVKEVLSEELRARLDLRFVDDAGSYWYA